MKRNDDAQPARARVRETSEIWDGTQVRDRIRHGRGARQASDNRGGRVDGVRCCRQGLGLRSRSGQLVPAYVEYVCVLRLACVRLMGGMDGRWNLGTLEDGLGRDRYVKIGGRMGWDLGGR